MQTFFLCFIPLFVAMDVIGNLPVYIALTSQMTPQQSAKVGRLAGLTALTVGLLFMWCGRGIIALLHVEPADFKIAGGAVLFLIAVSGVLHDQPRHHAVRKEHVGIVPMGVPLMVGPATLVTLLLLADMHANLMVGLALVANIAFTMLCFRMSRCWNRLLHVDGMRAVSRVVHFFLASVAVMMIRVGILEIVRGM